MNKKFIQDIKESSFIVKVMLLISYVFLFIPLMFIEFIWVLSQIIIASIIIIEDYITDSMYYKEND